MQVSVTSTRITACLTPGRISASSQFLVSCLSLLYFLFSFASRRAIKFFLRVYILATWQKIKYINKLC
nr:MAG TPA: hypothetical protein [Bacteriophage sp.]DAR23187.1 MAG TPA: hypothetical protein [Caudoviricetes sp.]